jgi:hypothetical protein
MTTQTAAPISTSIPRPVMDRAGKTAVSLLILLGIGALAGGVALVAKPDGSVKVAIIKGISVLHPIYFGVGLAIAVASVLWGWPTFRGWRATRA